MSTIVTQKAMAQYTSSGTNYNHKTCLNLDTKLLKQFSYHFLSLFPNCL